MGYLKPFAEEDQREQIILLAIKIKLFEHLS
jgi:hypothetical protein